MVVGGGGAMKLRRLNDVGVERLRDFLASLVSENPEPLPSVILTDPTYSEVLPVEIRVENVPFARRFEAGQYLYERLAPLRTPERMHYERDSGLWSWLALFYFDQLCPTTPGGSRNPRDRARWIPSFDEPRRYYRHLLVGPYLIFKRYAHDPEMAMVLLCTRVDAPGEIVEQFVSRPQLVTCPAAVGVATKLYHVPDKTFRRGAAGKEAGSVRRLAEVLMQFDVTFDLQAMSADDLMALLPKEFDRFR